MHEILEYIYDLLPSNKKQRSNGWEYFNAHCCILTENQDTKKRGNALFSEDSFMPVFFSLPILLLNLTL